MIMRIWHAINRKTDMQTLWPPCKEFSENLDQAKCAFYFHVSNDPAWTKHYTRDELIDFVNALE
jgi:hypothetical protein